MSQVNVANDRVQINSVQVTTSDLMSLCGDPEFGFTGEGVAVLSSIVEAFCMDMIVLSQCGEDASEEALQAVRRRARQMKASLPLLVEALANR